MALRYSMDHRVKTKPFAGPLAIPEIHPDPVQISFRPETPLCKVAESILRHSFVDVCAAVGSGKSTRLPRKLAAKSDTVVFMVVPNHLLAVQLYDYVTSPAYPDDGVESHLFLTGLEPIPERGIIYLGASVLTSLLLQYYGRVIKDRIIYLDEAHESDAYSHIIRSLCVQMGARMLARASATFSPDKFRMRETPSKVTEGTYDPSLTPDTWDLSDSSKPWYYHQQGHTLIFTDSRTHAMGLQGKYERAGYRVYHLTSRANAPHFRRVIQELGQSKHLVAVVADYSFRSGFTFNVTNVIDTGQVYYTTVQDGIVKREARPMFSLECEQAKGRAGRLENKNAAYHRPTGKLERVRVELESVEAEAAACLFQLLGFKPDLKLASRVMASMELPSDVDVVGALNGEVPLQCLAKERAPPPVEKPEVVPQERNGTGRVLFASRSPSPLLSQGGGCFPPIAPILDLDGEYERAIRAHMEENGTGLKEGLVYVAPDLPHNYHRYNGSSFTSVDDILRHSDRNPRVENLWARASAEDRQYAVSSLLHEYNMLAVETGAMRDALMEILSERSVSPNLHAARCTVTKIAEETKDAVRQRKYTFRTLCRYLISTTELVVVTDTTNVAISRKKYYRSIYEERLSHIWDLDTGQYADYLNHALEERPPPYGWPNVGPCPEGIDRGPTDSGISRMGIGVSPHAMAIQYAPAYQVTYASRYERGKVKFVKGTTPKMIEEYEMRRSSFSSSSQSS